MREKETKRARKRARESWRDRKPVTERRRQRQRASPTDRPR